MKHELFALIALTVLATGTLTGQSPAQSSAPTPPPSSGPVPLKRVAPATTTMPREPIPTPDKYPFTDLITVLEDGNAVSGPVGAERSDKRTRRDSSSDTAVPKDYQPDKDVPLTEAAREAVHVSEAWVAARQTPVEGKDGRVLYTYGAGLPTVVCAPLRVCVVELQAGEKVVGEPHIGDSVRWMISPATAGKDELAVAMIVIKPKSPGLDTNLLVTTDRRAYHLRLISKPEEYLARVAFAYPDDEAARWRAYLARQQEQRRREEFEASQIAPIETLENLYFNYRIQGGEQTMRPVRVLDDGKKTYIQMTPEAAHRELPLLAVLGPDGRAELVNYRVKGDMYIVDRLFDRGALIVGVGKKALRAEIVRGTYRGKKLKGDPYTGITTEQRSVPRPAAVVPSPQVRNPNDAITNEGRAPEHKKERQ